MNRKIKIGINLLFINKFPGGSVTYSKKLLEAISVIDTENEYFVYVNKDCKESDFVFGKNFKVKVLPFSNSNVFKRYLWEQFVLPFYIQNDKIFLLHSLGYVTPFLTRKKKVVSILDINYIGHGGDMDFLKRILLGTMVSFSAWFSTKIITISNFSKSQIIRYTKIDHNKISVTYLSGSNDFVIDEQEQFDKVIEKYNLHGAYIIAFSSPSPHKNIKNLLIAFKILVVKYDKLKLVLVGYQSKNGELMEFIEKENLSSKVVFTGYVPDEEVYPLICASKVFVFPSRYEGFGIPILDAQTCKVPIASSNAASLPEIGGKGVTYFNPESANEMADTISKYIENEEFASKSIRLNTENRVLFSWEKTAKETISIYMNIINKIQHH
jgi:glycosyltransferase involved in cell wall biosynthesis